MKKLICATLALTLLFGSALAASIELTNGPVMVRAKGELVSLERFQILGTDADGNCLIFDGSLFYTVDAASLEKTVGFSSELPALGVLETLSIDAEGEDVLALQIGLKRLGYLRAGADGVFGSRTQTAVRAFQEAVGLEATGDADEVTQLLVASLSGDTEYVEGTPLPEILFAPILGRTKIDLQPIMDAGLTLTYSELDGTGFISDGTVVEYDASGDADLDKYVLSVRFGLYVRDDGNTVDVAPALLVSCLCVRRPVLTEVTVKGGDARGTAPVENLTVRLEGVETVEEGVVFLSDEMVDALAQTEEKPLLRVSGQYNAFTWRVQEDLSPVGIAAQGIRP